MIFDIEALKDIVHESLISTLSNEKAVEISNAVSAAVTKELVGDIGVTPARTRKKKTVKKKRGRPRKVPVEEVGESMIEKSEPVVEDDDEDFSDSFGEDEDE